MSREVATSWRWGGCHCGAVRFEVALANPALAQACNCSICAMTGFVHLIVPESRFRLASGADVLTSYTFNTHTARHLFCRICGVKSFYRPRSNPDGWSVNARCLDDHEGLTIDVSPFDGAHWEEHAGALAELSRESS
jgi:hypothetical protein